VTGAASDVGREIALNLAAEGASVAVNYRSSGKEADAIVAEIKAKGGNAKAYQADVSDFAAVNTMVDGIVKDFGGLNILINNAGIAKRQRFVETTPRGLASPDRRLSLWRDPLLPCRGAASGDRQERPHRQPSSAILRASANPGSPSSPPPAPASSA
jgi:NAD(P)-dependent dehydrogenase (short-subunit alcohol dehydrogenase family)